MVLPIRRDRAHSEPDGAALASAGERWGKALETSVAFECAAPAHKDGEGGPDKLTVHEGQWAFCRFDARADGHAWKPSAGLPLSMLRHAAAVRLRERGKDKSPAG